MATALLRWRAVERERLFWELPYVDTTVLCDGETFPKLGSPKLRDSSALWIAFPDRLLHHMDRHGQYRLVVPRTAGCYIAAYPDEIDRTKQTVLRFRRREYGDLTPVMLDSNAFFWLWRAIGDGFDVPSGQVEGCPTCGAPDDECLAIAVALAHALPEAHSILELPRCRRAERQLQQENGFPLSRGRVDD